MPSSNNCSNRWLNSLILAILEQSWCSVSSRSGLGWRRESWEGGQVLGNIQIPLGLIWDQAINTERGSVTKNWTHTVCVFSRLWLKMAGTFLIHVHLQFQENHPWAKLVGFHHWTNQIHLSLLCFQSYSRFQADLRSDVPYRHQALEMLACSLLQVRTILFYSYVLYWPELLTAPLHSGRVFVIVNVQWWVWSAGRPQDQLKNLLLATA